MSDTLKALEALHGLKSSVPMTSKPAYFDMPAAQFFSARGEPCPPELVGEVLRVEGGKYRVLNIGEVT